MRHGPRIVFLTLGATAVLVALLADTRLPATRAVAIWVVLLTAIALRELVRSFDLRHEPKSGFERILSQRPKPAPEPSVFGVMEREITLSMASVDHAHRRLFPLLRASAAARLGRRHGIELERRPDVARRLLGDDTWDLIRPDRPVPRDRHAAGPRREEIVAAIERLEAL